MFRVVYIKLGSIILLSEMYILSEFYHYQKIDCKYSERSKEKLLNPMEKTIVLGN